MLHVAMLTAAFVTGQTPTIELVEPVRKIWDQAPHNAFTDLIRFRERWYCVFREGDGHAKGPGTIRVITSADGKDWRAAALLAWPGIDLRDPHLSRAPGGELMLIGGAAEPATRDPLTNHYSFVSFSKDGATWSKPRRVGPDWHWLWRATWSGARAYTVGYHWDPKVTGKYRASLFQSGDGVKYDRVTTFELVNPTEATLELDGPKMLCLQRRDGKPNSAMLGISSPPYRNWEWKDLGMYLGGPHFVRGPDGQWWAAGRIIDQGTAKTAVARLDVAAGKLIPVLTLPSGGDSSYPGLVWHDGLLWISYYSSHEGKTSIYLAKGAQR